MKKILVLFGSPHKSGATARELNEYLTMQPKDTTVTTVNCYETPVFPCTDCKSCATTGKCKLRDMDYIYSNIETCDEIVFAFPVYNLSFPAPMKAYIDRLQVYFNRRFSLLQKPPIVKSRTATLIITNGSDKYGGASHALEALSMICTILNVTDKTVITSKTSN